MKKILLLFVVIFIIIFFVSKTNNDKKNIANYEINSGDIRNCIFEVYEGKEGLENYRKQVGHALVLGEGKFLTSKHIISDLFGVYKIYGNDNIFDVEKIWFDKNLDLAYLKGNKNISCGLKITGNTTNLTIGQEIFSRVYRDEKTVKKTGKIVGLNQNIKIEGNIYENLISTNLELEYGDSGSPLFNLSGEFIGINTAISQIDMLSYTIALQQSDISENMITID